MSFEARRGLLARKNEEAEAGGGEKRVAKHHEQGKLTARERLAHFFDAGTFVEVDKFVTHRCTNFGMENTKFLGDGIVTGYGKVDGRTVYAYAQDFTVFGGSLSLTMANKICKVMDMALKNGAPQTGATNCTVQLYESDEDGTDTAIAGVTETVATPGSNGIFNGALTYNTTAGKLYWIYIEVTVDSATRKGKIPVIVPVRTS